ncbi:MAG: radical SAM protein, partial [Pyrobaculum sp.]
ELVREVKKAGVELYLSVNPAVPKPQTPLQYHPMTELRELERKIELVRKMPHDAFSHYDPTLAVIQAAIALGGRETFRHVEASVDTPLAYWKGLLRRGELRYVFSPRREPTPWSHVRGFYPPSRLWEIYQKFLESACS